MSPPAQLNWHQHGKSKVRLGRTWREGNVHYFCEWRVDTMLESAMEHSFLTGSNRDMTPTDTQKNTVYYIAKKCSKRCSPEEYAITLGQHFVDTYPLVSKAKITVEQSPWKRLVVDEKKHNHGFVKQGSEIRTCYVEVADGYKQNSPPMLVQAGLKDLEVLKTTQSGYTGFLQDKFTLLPNSDDRILATSVTCTWRYKTLPRNFCNTYFQIRKTLLNEFFGNVDTGVYSPAVQTTLYDMCKEVIAKEACVDSIYMYLPNKHFIPCKTVGDAGEFNDDVYYATSEPHGQIEASVTRGDISSHVAKL